MSRKMFVGYVNFIFERGNLKKYKQLFLMGERVQYFQDSKSSLAFTVAITKLIFHFYLWFNINYTNHMTFQAAYNNNTLGLPKFCPEENILTIGRRELYTFLSHYHTPDRMVLAGVGVEHDKVVELAQKHFVSKTPVWAESEGVIDSRLERDNSLAQYTGGLELVSCGRGLCA